MFLVPGWRNNICYFAAKLVRSATLPYLWGIADLWLHELPETGIRIPWFYLFFNYFRRNPRLFYPKACHIPYYSGSFPDRTDGEPLFVSFICNRRQLYAVLYSFPAYLFFFSHRAASSSGCLDPLYYPGIPRFFIYQESDFYYCELWVSKVLFISLFFFLYFRIVKIID